MGMALQNILNSQVGTVLGLSLSRLPPRAGYGLARRLGGGIAALKKYRMVRALRANQWVAHGEGPDTRELDRLTEAACESTARSLYEFWHYYHNPRAVLDMVSFDPSFPACFERARRDQTGLLMVIPHLSNFDLVGRAAVLRGFHLHVLSYPRPPGGYQAQNELRELPGLTVTPLSGEGLRQASLTLRSRGAVLTGIDRPLPIADSKYRARFFGRPAILPVFHIRLAIKHDLPVVVIGGQRDPGGGYRVWAADPVAMARRADLVDETVENAEAVLTEVARVISAAPDQWSMFYPVWPEALSQMPV